MIDDNPPDHCSSHFTYDESASEAIINAVAWQTACDPTDLEPLYTVIDPDALNELIKSADENDLRVEFGYEGCAVTIVSGGDLYVRSTPEQNSGCRISTGNVLLLDEPLDTAEDHSSDFHAPPVSFDGADTLVVTFSAEGAEAWRDRIITDAVDRSINRRIIIPGDFTRSSGTHSADVMAHSKDVQYDTVPDPTDLTAIDLLLTHFLEERESTDNDLIVCFHSISELLQHVSLSEADSFLDHVLSRLRMAGAAGYFYLDDDDHDDETRPTLDSLFDTILSRTIDGQWVHRVDNGRPT